MTPVVNPAAVFLFILLLAGIAAYVWIWAPEAAGGAAAPALPRAPANTDADEVQWLVIPEKKDALVMAEMAVCRVNRPERRIPVQGVDWDDHHRYWNEYWDKEELDFWLLNSGDSTSPSYSPLFSDDDD